MERPAIQVVIIRNVDDAIGSQPQIGWGCAYLTEVLANKKISAVTVGSASAAAEAAPDAELWITASGPIAGESEPAANVAAGLPTEAEAFAIRRGESEGRSLLAAVGRDVRGLLYAVLELADIANHAERPLETLTAAASQAVRPANPVRGITRLFTSEAEDKPWFYDRTFWDEYLTELATQRFNRFTFGIGAGYDYLIDRIVPDSYFCFFYPFVVDVPGYDVRVEGLDEAERERNLAMLRYIGAAAALRGLDFRLGLWNHAYDYGPRNTNKQYRINGVDGDNHAAYCRDALACLLSECPEIKGLTFRVHFEGGVPEPTHEFWRVVMERAGEAGNLAEIDFHSKGVGEELIGIVSRTGKPLVLSTKYWAEHMGPPYHQASIREREFGKRTSAQMDKSVRSGNAQGDIRPPSTGHHEARVSGMEITSKRSYTRYGYADFMRDNRTFGIVHRIWPGTQRILLWGDPVIAAAIGRYAGFQGSLGAEWFEPLTFKGKKGSGRSGERELYEDEKLRLGVRDWTKFRYTYRLWGRLAYNPEANPNEWRRYLRCLFGEAAEPCERALAVATRILPFVTLVHAPSVANNVYWPEMYTNIPLVRGNEKADNPYAEFGWPANADFDMEPPYTFMNTSPLDPAHIYRINEFAADVLSGVRRGKLSPPEIADRLEAMADRSLQELREAESAIADPQNADFRRWAADVRIMAGIGRFFAHKFRAGLAFALHERTGGGGLLTETLEHYGEARRAWQDVVDASAGIYRSDLTFGHTPYSRGHWSDRLAAIDEDIAAVERLASRAESEARESGDMPGSAKERGLNDWLAPLSPGERTIIAHTPPAGFVKGQPLAIRAKLAGPSAEGTVVRLHYRHVNQAEPYREAVMDAGQGDAARTAAIPAAYTDSPYALQYFFELVAPGGDAWMSPGLDERLSEQPYHVLNAISQDKKEC